jgi:hypothetical protein
LSYTSRVLAELFSSNRQVRKCPRSGTFHSIPNAAVSPDVCVLHTTNPYNKNKKNRVYEAFALATTGPENYAMYANYTVGTSEPPRGVPRKQRHRNKPVDKHMNNEELVNDT